MKRLLTVMAVLAFLGTSPGGRVAMAAEQPSPVEKAIEDVKGKLDDLIGAKDEQSPDELAYRLATLGKVIDLSITEASDLKVKLLSVNADEGVLPWRNGTVDQLNEALDHYNQVKGDLENKENAIDLAGVKEEARAFKEWRDAHFTPVADAARDYLLIVQEGGAIATAQKRADRIGDDVTKLKNARQKVAEDLGTLLLKATSSIAEAANLNKTAHDRFWAQFIIPLQTASSTEASSTATEASSSETLATPEIEAAENAVATSTSAEATSTAPAAPSQPSIRDLVKSSLTKVREAYQVFIEMSTLVRKVP
jgi:hypothetical protein